MNDAEFDSVRRRMGSMFPSLVDWFGALDGKSADGVPSKDHSRRHSIRARWRAALDDAHVDDAMSAIDEIAKRPEDPWPFPADKERAAAIIAHEARRIASARRERDNADRYRTSRRRTPVDVRGLRADLFGRIESDERHDEQCRQHRAEYGRCRVGCPVAQLVAAEILAEPCDIPSSEDTYRCRQCRDSGLVSVLTSAEVRRIADSGDVGSGFLRTVSLACFCDGLQAVAYRRSELPTGEKFFEVFDAAKYVPADMSRAALVVACRAAVESVGGRRIQEFDAWNRRATA